MNNEVFIWHQNPNYEELQKNAKNATEFLLNDIRCGLVKPGDRVVIKPNFVKESHIYKPLDWEYVITHTEVIRFVLNAVVEAMKGKGSVYVIDAPQTDSDYDEIIKRVKLEEIVEECQSKTTVSISFFDLREERWFYKQGIIVRKKKLKGDPLGYVEVNLKAESEFFGKGNKDYYGADYDMSETRRYHNDIDNIYIMSKTILSSDVFINLPKMKTHKLAGITCCLKNLVGTCVIKNSIPHHTIGSPENGGDKFEKETAKGKAESGLKATALKILRYKNPIINYPFILVKWVAGKVFGSPQTETIRNGMWHGNDTIWRATLDLNKILLYADSNGVMHNTPQRKYFAVVDGIIAGDGNGPMEPDPKPIGVLIAGSNPVAIDAVVGHIMGFNVNMIPTVSKAFQVKKYKLADFKMTDIRIFDSLLVGERYIQNIDINYRFRPHFGWRGIER